MPKPKLSKNCEAVLRSKGYRLRGVVWYSKKRRVRTKKQLLRICKRVGNFFRTYVGYYGEDYIGPKSRGEDRKNTDNVQLRGLCLGYARDIEERTERMKTVISQIWEQMDIENDCYQVGSWDWVCILVKDTELSIDDRTIDREEYMEILKGIRQDFKVERLMDVHIADSQYFEFLRNGTREAVWTEAEHREWNPQFKEAVKK